VTGGTLPCLGITIGDVAGIGPEITAKALLQHPELRKVCRPIAIGDAEALARAVTLIGGDPSAIRTLAAPSAATNDPRFEPVRVKELSNLRYSVDVLFPPEKTEMSELNPAVFGVIVEDQSGARRGLLLPDIPGITDADQQVEIAARKAGIAAGEPVRLWRFKVERFREKSSAADEHK